LEVGLGDRLYDVHVDALDDGYDLEVFDETFGDPVDVSEFIGRFGYTRVSDFAEALVDGFYVDGPSEFELLVRTVGSK
jgi:hypothetical protein